MIDLNGVWQIVSAELGGNALPLPGVSLVIEDDVFIATTPEGREVGRIHWPDADVAPTDGPTSIDMVTVRGPHVGRVIPAVVRCEGDSLDLCYDVSGGPRPGDFTTGGGSWRMLVRYRRAEDPATS